MARWFAVIDGADQGRVYALPQAGTVLIGNSQKHTDICLHDLYVARVHCQLEVADGKLTLSDGESPKGTLVNGAKIAQHDLQVGEVVRVGNSYLRLEEGDTIPQTDEDEPAAPAARAPAETKKLPQLALDRIHELNGHELGHFQIGEALGCGHYGVVFRAQDVKANQTVALKVLSPVFPTGDEELRRFVRVIRPVLLLNHAGITPLRGVGKVGPYVWLARELVEGESLAASLSTLATGKKPKWKPALRLALQLVAALTFLRKHRLVHANITPANILLTANNGPARLTDLGLWDALAGTRLQADRLEKKLFAELPYLSPEHLDPAAPVDDLSDQYCVGAVLYARLTGRPPFGGATPEETMRQVRLTIPVKPKEYHRAIPDDLQAVVLRMLSKHPEDRFPAPDAIMGELEQLAGSASEAG